ncbi:hypothetical protein E3N88_12722 [Mikania micrantha]|uniref:ADF-H domain-containing protein n=1 Tax=Mikania micrantha TaxID=192012 RepID=A0A5N6P6R9_9ASTR|nr:hypothetical protein E3N88_12722 [Mikania micrantha]
MVSKRQILARRRFKQEHPELFPKPEPAVPKDPNKKKKKKKSNFKRKKSDNNDPSKPKRSTSKKHPLRIPGMRPGDSCFICKADNHIAKNCPEKAQWEKHKVLFVLQRGHSLKNCPDKNEDNINKKLCYNCGEFGHSLASCPLPVQDGGTQYATCFVCKQQGHLSKDCPKNAHGIYPKGGCCKICSGVTHLAKDCPNKSARSFGMSTTGVEGMARGRVTKFTSGDDLEDDFTVIDDGKEKNKSVPKADTDFSESSVKVKKKQGMKVANAASGMAVHDDCKLKFLELKSKRNYRFVTFKIEDQQVMVDKIGGPDESYEDFTNSLPANECRYAVFDFDFTTDENVQKSKIFFVAWCPDTSKVRMKMVYASSKDRFKRELDGIQVELQATDPSEMSLDIVKSRAI